MRRVKYEEWEPIYHDICEYFSFDPDDDERAAKILADLTTRDALSLLSNIISDKTVTVCGNGPSLVFELRNITGTIIAADAAAGVLYKSGIIPEIIVTDLDGIDDYAIDLNRNGTILVVHAHGDNIPRIKAWVPKLVGPLLLTTQGKPFDNVYNFGGFTDGDRAVFMAYALKASEVRLVGFDLDDPDVTPMKKGKLCWAKKLLASLGHEC
jgi:2-amino-4-hydroxy-6-hydroxymethyldihydropteridine diphosphokinase